MAVTIIPEIKATKAVFNKVVFPLRNLTEKYNGKADNINTKTIAIKDINNVDNAIFLRKSKFL